MVMRALGLRKISCHKFILGYSDEETVKLDFDQMPFSKARYWAVKALKRFRLQGFIILKSSKNCYHVIFDKTLSWAENMSVVAWVALLSHSKTLQTYCLMQCIKGCSTLRVSNKGEKPAPRIVYRYGNQEHNVKEFLENRRLIKKIGQKTRKKGHF